MVWVYSDPITTCAIYKVLENIQEVTEILNCDKMLWTIHVYSIYLFNINYAPQNALYFTYLFYLIFLLVLGQLLRRGSLDPDRRRLSLGTVPHRGSDVGLDPNHAAILFRDSRGVSNEWTNFLYWPIEESNRQIDQIDYRRLRLLFSRYLWVS